MQFVACELLLPSSVPIGSPVPVELRISLKFDNYRPPLPPHPPIPREVEMQLEVERIYPVGS